MHVLAAGQRTRVETLGFFCVSDSGLFFFFKGVGIAQLTGGATEKEPGTLRSCKKAIANPSFGEKYIQLTVSIFCFERGRKSSYSNYLPTLQPYRLVL